MSGDIGYSGGSSGGFNVNFTLPNINFSSGTSSSNVTVWEGPDWYKASVGTSADVSNLIEGMIDSDLSKVGSLANPYSSRIQIAERWVQYPNGTGFWAPIFAENTTYTEFENQATQVQINIYNDIYSAFEISIDETIGYSLSQTSESYDNDMFGDTSKIYDVNQDILNIQKEITLLGVEDTITNSYNRVADTNNSDAISKLQSQLEELQSEYKSLTDGYKDASDAKDFQDEMNRLRTLENEKKKGDWDISYNYIPDKAPPVGRFAQIYEVEQQQRLEFTNDFINGKKHLWMAGGILYDAPKAGDLHFNVTGNLNTVRFLGMEDKNTNDWYNWTNDKYHDFSSKTFGNMAGDMFFSVKPIV